MKESEYTDQQVILIKLGGSIITNKDGFKQPDIPRINQLAGEIHRSNQNSRKLMVIANGAGSYGHSVAKKYDTMDGLVNSESRRGLVELRKSLDEIHTMLIDRLAATGEYPISLSALSFLTSQNHKPSRLFIDPVVNLLEHGLLPVTSGNAVTDSTTGFTIFSGEKVLNLLALALLKTNYKPKLVIQVSNSRGVEDRSKNADTIPTIDQINIRSVLRKSIHLPSSTDVTGGMAEKVREAYALAKKGVPTFIISPQADNLYKALEGSTAVEGTMIRFNHG